jgi:ArsR family transcriptional regulator
MLDSGFAAHLSATTIVRSSNHRKLSPHAVELIAARFKVLSEPARLRLIMALEGGERNVSQLVERTGVTQTNVSRHLQALARAGVVARRREGIQVYYHIADPTIFELCDHVCGSLARHFDQQAESARLFG